MRSTARWLGLCVLMFPVSALAQDAEQETPGGSRDDEARAMFDAARIAFDDGRYEDALGSFQRSYELSHRPALLYNMATCADRLRRDEDALRWFEQYLEEVPDAENRRGVEARIETLRESVANEQNDVPEGGAPLEDDDGGSVLGAWWFWTIIAVVVVGAGVGITVALTTSSGTSDPVTGDLPPGGIVEALRW